MRDFLKSYFYWFLILIFIFCTNHSTQGELIADICIQFEYVRLLNHLN